MLNRFRAFSLSQVAGSNKCSQSKIDRFRVAGKPDLKEATPDLSEAY